MEYVIRLRDKRVHDAVLVFLRSLGIRVSDMDNATDEPRKAVSEQAALTADEDARTLGLAAFDAGFDADEPDISNWVVKEPNPKYGK